MMHDQRRELETLRAQRFLDKRQWEERERFFLNRIEELERKLKAVRDELAEARQTIENLTPSSHRRPWMK